MELRQKILRREQRLRALNLGYQQVSFLQQTKALDRVLREESPSRSYPALPSSSASPNYSAAAACPAAAEKCSSLAEFDVRVSANPPCAPNEASAAESNQDSVMLEFVLKELEALQNEKARLAQENSRLEHENHALNAMLDISNMSLLGADDSGEGYSSELNTRVRSGSALSPETSSRLEHENHNVMLDISNMSLTDAEDNGEGDADGKDGPNTVRSGSESPETSRRCRQAVHRVAVLHRHDRGLR